MIMLRGARGYGFNSSFTLPYGTDRFVPGPTQVCPGRRSGRCGGLCRGVVLPGPGPRLRVLSVCVAPGRAAVRPPPCVFERYGA